MNGAAETPAGRLRRLAEQSRHAAAAAPKSAAMKLHRMVLQLRQGGRVYAPIRGRFTPAARAPKRVAATAFEPWNRRPARLISAADGSASAARAAWREHVAKRSAASFPVSRISAIGRPAFPHSTASRAVPYPLAAGLAAVLFKARSHRVLGWGSVHGGANAIGATANRASRHAMALRPSVSRSGRRQGAASAHAFKNPTQPLSPSFAPRRFAGAALAAWPEHKHMQVGPEEIRPATVLEHTASMRAPRISGHQGATQNPAYAPETPRGAVALQHDVAEALRRVLEQGARRPPAGGAGFDPRLTPSWAGLQMPG